MKKLIFVALMLTFIQASPQTNQQAFQQGRAPIELYNGPINQVEQSFQSIVNIFANARKSSKELYELAQRLNPKTLEGCQKVSFATEFCFINFEKEMREYVEYRQCKALATQAIFYNLQSGQISNYTEYKKKNCARFVEKIKETK